MERPPIEQPFTNKDNSISIPWANWINGLWVVVRSLDSSGTTAQRPTEGLFVGKTYYDTTLGKPIWLESVRPTVWVDADGAAV